MNTAALPANSRLAGLAPTAIDQVLAAARALELGRAHDADAALQLLLKSHSAHPEVLRLLSGLHSLQGRPHEAVAIMQRAVALRPHDALYRNTLGAAYIGAQRYDDAIHTLREATARDPNLAVAWFNLGLALMRSMRVREASDALRRAVALSPDQFNARVILGDTLRAQGDVDAATIEYRRVLAREANAGMAWWGLAELRNALFDAADIARMRSAAESNASIADRVATGMALAKALDDAGDYAGAFDALTAAHRLMRDRVRWDADVHHQAVDRVLEAFTPPPIGAEDSTLGREAIFVVSLPRSGSTLIEQVLAAHSHVEGAGELPDVPAVLSEESNRRRAHFPQWIAAMSPHDWTRLGRRYLERTARWRERHPRFTDKLPYNWFYAGAVHAMLPSARIVIVRRDPLETCFSCYRQHLADNEYTRDFNDLAAFWRDFDRAAAHWSRLYPTRVTQVQYERLIAEPEPTIRDLLAFCELPFEEGCLSFHDAAREVHTPSATQVREPLRRDTARADRYGALLDPLRAALGLPLFDAKR